MKMYEKLLNGEITESEWHEYCMKQLENLVKENRKTLDKLKNK